MRGATIAAVLLTLLVLGGALALERLAAPGGDATYRLQGRYTGALLESVTWGEVSLDVPATMPVYALGGFPEGPGRAWRLAGALGMEDRVLVPTAQSPRDVRYVVTGTLDGRQADLTVAWIPGELWLRVGDPLAPGTPEVKLDDERVLERALAFLAAHDLVPDHAQVDLSTGAVSDTAARGVGCSGPGGNASTNATPACDPSHTATERGASFPRVLDGRPVLGSGVSVRFSHPGLSRVTVDLPALEQTGDEPTLSLSDAMEVVERGEPAARVDAANRCESAHLDRVALAYTRIVPGSYPNRAYPVIVFEGACTMAGNATGTPVTVQVPGIAAAYR